MSEQPVKVPGKSLFQRKVAGIPVVYGLGGLAVVAAVVAWRLPKTSEAAAVPVVAAPSAEEVYLADNEVALPGPLSGPSVGAVSSPLPPTDTSQNASIETNEQWLRKGVVFLGLRGVPGGEAQLLLQQYLDGKTLSYAHGKHRDAVIAEYGVPPYVIELGGTAPDIARRQGPLPREHIVKGPNDNTVDKLSALYYGKVDTYLRTTMANANAGKTVFAVGEAVRVPSAPQAAARQGRIPLRHYVVGVNDNDSLELALLYYNSGSQYAQDLIIRANGGRKVYPQKTGVLIPAPPKTK